MQEPHLTYSDYAVFARQAPERIYRDCEVSVFHASGPGGQCVNTTDSAVRMRHLPTGITVTARDSRSQYLNRQACLTKLQRIFEERSVAPKRRKPTRVPRGSKERRLQDKKRRGGRKALRGRPNLDD